MNILKTLLACIGLRMLGGSIVPLTTCTLIVDADAPDNSGVNNAAQRNAELAEKAFQWFSQEYAKTAPDRERAANEASQVTQANLENMRLQTDLARDYDQYNRTTFRPLEQRIVQDAQNYDTAERRQAAADGAVADVNQAIAQQREARMADLASYGISPDMARSQSAMASGGINASKAVASAAKGARDKVEATGRAMMADAALMGRNLPSAQATAVQTATGAGAGAVGSSQAGLGAVQSGAGLMNTGFQTAIQGNQSSGNLFAQGANIDLGARGQDLGFLSSVFGSFMKSDPKVKKNRREVEPAVSMSQLRETPMEEWQYDPKKGGPQDGNRTRMGPMADKAQETMGDEVAPNGELLNVASMVGVVANAVKDIDQRLTRAGI